MSDQDTTPTADDAPEATGNGNEESGAAPEQTPEEEFDKDRALEKIRKANSEAKSLRDRNKELEAKLREYEDANKSESEKTAERLSKAEKTAQEAEARALRLEVALEKGLTAAQARRLVGSTKEELEQDADELLESFGGGRKTPPSRKPSESLRGGGDPEQEPEETDPRKLAARIKRRY